MVRVIDYFQANSTVYLVMEYLEGVPLFRKMQQLGGRIPAQELLPKLPALLRDLDRVHQTGVLHRDISPDNIMWMPDGALKLLDFGSARSMTASTSMTVMLKHGFAPVEQYTTKGQGPYTDVYALAATIYYCLTGVTPPSAVERLTEDTLQAPTALGAALTPTQEAALLWALSVQPSVRPQTVQLFSDSLFQQESSPGGETVFIGSAAGTSSKRSETVFIGSAGRASTQTGGTAPVKPPLSPKQRRKALFLIFGSIAAVFLFIGVAIALFGNDPTATTPYRPPAFSYPPISFPPVDITPVPSWEDNVLMADPAEDPSLLERSSVCSVFGSDLTRQEISSVTFLDTLKTAPQDAWDVSQAQDGSRAGLGRL